MRRRPAAPARQTLRPGHSTFRFAQSFESVWHFLAAGQNSRDRACGTRWKNPGMNAPTSVAYRSASRAATGAAIGHAPRARHLIVNSNCYVSQLKMPERAVPPKAYSQPSSRNLITRMFPRGDRNHMPTRTTCGLPLTLSLSRKGRGDAVATGTPCSLSPPRERVGVRGAFAVTNGNIGVIKSRKRQRRYPGSLQMLAPLMVPDTARGAVPG